MTAFQTPLGLYQFTVMPFGLVNASASYSRLMRKLLEGMQCVDNFIDDVIIYTSTFQEHSSVVREFLQRLRAADLTVKPSKFYWLPQSWVSRTYCWRWEVETFTRESDCYPKLQPTFNQEAGTIFNWYGGFLQEVHSEFFSNSRAIDWPHQERTTQ